MSQPLTKPPPSGSPEADPCVCVKFHRKHPNGAVTFHEVDCLIKAVVSGYKEDLRNELGPPETQTWIYNDQVITDSSRLMDYGIEGDEEMIIIKVTNSNN